MDLNLLVALDALMEHRNVTRAAQHIGQSQPKMSRALSKLRAAFNDDPLVRSSTGLVPSPRGERFARVLGPVLDAIREIVASQSLAREEWRSKAVLAMPDHQALLLLPRLLPQLRERAPQLDIVTDPFLAGALRRLERGEMDLAVGQIGTSPPPRLSAAQPLHRPFRLPAALRPPGAGFQRADRRGGDCTAPRRDTDRRHSVACDCRSAHGAEALRGRADLGRALPSRPRTCLAAS